MNRNWIRWSFVSFAVAGSLVFLFQNCGPAKLAADGTNLPSSSNSDTAGVGSKVDLTSLSQASPEPAANVLNFAAPTVPDFDYAIDAPVIENVVLKKNDFDRIIWVHEPTSSIAALGDALNVGKFSDEMLGNYSIFGYRGATPFILGKFRLINKGASTLNVNSVGALQINQKLLSSDPATESYLLSVEAPDVDLTSVRFTFKNNGAVVDGHRAILVTKAYMDSLDIEVKLTDLTGQSFTKLVNFASKPVPIPPNTIQALALSPLNVTTSTVTINYTLLNATSLGEDELAFIHIVDLPGTTVATADFMPTVSTSMWTGTQNFSRTITLPATMVNGDYLIKVGFYQNHTPFSRATLNPGANVTVDLQVRYTIGKLHLAR
jgi:hypothetical protein